MAADVVQRAREPLSARRTRRRLRVHPTRRVARRPDAPTARHRQVDAARGSPAGRGGRRARRRTGDRLGGLREGASPTDRPTGHRAALDLRRRAPGAGGCCSGGCERMTANDVLVIAWLVLAHLIADFVLQTDRVATAKFATGARAWRGLAAHWFTVAVAMLPVPFAFGGRGLVALLAISIVHAVIDRSKVVLTRRVEAAALEEAALMHEAPAVAASLGSAWTPVPAALFVLDQIAHG